MIPTAIGLDLSLTGTGVASSRGWTRVLHPPAKARGHVRLDWIRDQVLEHVGSVDEHLVVVEGPSYGNQGAGRQSGHHERAGLWWLITHALWKRGIDYAVASPAGRAKYATGKGNAAKADVVREVTRRFAWFAGGEDEADALVLAAMGADWLGRPLVTMPQAHRKALEAVAWPAALSGPSADGTRPVVALAASAIPEAQIAAETVTVRQAVL
jgi:Holliday junction resolvasome RuvABC endonuclease subunit